MSMHNIPLTELEREGLEKHGLDIGTPSQLSDAFRQGMAWALNGDVDYAALLNRQPDPKHPLMAILMGAVVRIEELSEAVKLCNEDKDGSAISPTLTAMIDAQNAFLASLEASKLCYNMVLKVQRPIVSSEDNPGLLVYNEDRTLHETLTLDENLMSWFEDDLKMYVKARLWMDGTLQLITRVEDQPW